MRSCRRAIIVLVLCVAGPASAQDVPAVMTRAQACLKANVERVVAIDSDPYSAANFLLTFTCAREVTDESRYEYNVQALKQFGMFAGLPLKGKASPPIPVVAASVSPETGDIILPPAKSGDSPDFSSFMLQSLKGVTGQMAGTAVSVDLKTLAGDLVVAAFQRRRAGK